MANAKLTLKVTAFGDIAAGVQFHDTIVKWLKMAGTLMNNYTAMMKQHCTINCFETNCYSL
jgi:hypothetical protein